MPLVYGDLKDKYILLEGAKYRPYIHIFGELDPVALDLCETMVLAQKVLDKWPTDCYEGSLIGERGWRSKVDKQVDKTYRIKRRKPKGKRKYKRRMPAYYGRGIAGIVPKGCR